MLRPKQDRSARKLYIVVYGVLCVIMAAVGWTSVMLLVPGGEASVASRTPANTASSAAATPTPTDDSPTLAPGETPGASPTKALFYMDLYRPGTFISQMNREYCMAGAVQNMLNIIGPTSDVTDARQTEIGKTIVSLTTKQDSINGGFGPNGWALTMAKLGAGTYKVVNETTFDQAMRDSALALAETGRPVGWLTWFGAHSWVMSGFRADADPVQFPNTFHIKGVFVVDPFYPRVSTIWGATLGPDTYRTLEDVAKNFVGWKRPEGHYPSRDGKWLVVLPVNS